MPLCEGESTPVPNVVLVISSLQGGGAERVLSDMANYWARRKWKITVATWSGPEVDDFYQLCPSVARTWLDVATTNETTRSKMRSHVVRVRKLRRLVRDVKPDVILSFIDWSNVLTIIASRRLPVRVIVSERVHVAHNHNLAWPWRVLRRLLYFRAQTVVAQTDDAARWLRHNCAAKTRTIPNPLRKLPNFGPPREALILAVGRLYHQKGFDLLLRAFSNIKGDFENWRLLIVGAGPEKETLLRLRDELLLSADVEFAEPRKDVEALMSRAGVVILPSRFEGFPNVLLEAMGMGAAVISTDCPSGPSEIINDGVNGRLVPVENVDELSKAMAELMSEPALRNSLGNEARKVCQRFRQDLIMREWEACLFPR